MKKELFNDWYDTVGKELALKVFPTDEVDEKFIRREAKKIFSSVYNLASTCFAEKLISMQDCVNGHIQYLIEQKYELLERKFCLEHLLKDETDILTDLYDSYIRSEVSKEYFNRNRSIHAKQIEGYKQSIHNIDCLLTELKSEYKNVQKLVVEY